MPDLNGSLTPLSAPTLPPQFPSPRWRASTSLICTACVAVLGLAACHGDDSTAPLTATSVTVLSGGSQTGTVGVTLATPLTVKVVDQYGNAVPDVTVTFADDASGALAATTVTTDASGIATDALTLGPNTGPDDVTASIDTPNGPVTTTLHETAT